MLLLLVVDVVVHLIAICWQLLLLLMLMAVEQLL
jgi:hypothetical protein